MGNWNPFDLVVLIVLVLSTFWGGMRGVVSQIAAIASWGVSWLLASRYYGLIEQFVPISEPWRRPTASLLVFIVSAVAITFAAHFLKKTMSLVGLKEFDRQMGALFGLLKGALICVVLAFFATIVSQKTLATIAASKSGHFFVSVATVVVSKTCANSEVGKKFLSTAELTFDSQTSVNSTGKSEASRSLQTLDAEVAQLKSYLKENVFSSTAAEIVEEADATETNDGTSNGKKSGSVWDWFRAGVQEAKSDATSTDETTKGAIAIDAKSQSTGKSDWDEYWPNFKATETGDSTGAAEERTTTLKGSKAETSNSWDALDSFATFFQSTFGGGATKTTNSNERNASDFATAAPANSSANTGDYLDEFIGVSSTSEKYADVNEANGSFGIGVDAETRMFGAAPRGGFATESDSSAPVKIGTSDGSILGREAAGSNRLRIVPPMPY